MKKLPHKQPIVFSKEISTIKINAISQQAIFDDSRVTPRVFPHPTIPIKVLIDRKIKQYASYHLNKLLLGIQWKFNQGCMELNHYNYNLDYVINYGCIPHLMDMKVITGKAFNGSKFKNFIVTGLEDDSLIGYWQKEQKVVSINRIYICFNFEDPLEYKKMVLKAVERREEAIQAIKYNFYVDNMDTKEVQQMPKKWMKRIQKLTTPNSLSNEDQEIILQQFKRAMNKILLNHHIIKQNLAIKIPNQQRISKKHIKKSIKFIKDSKIYQIIPQSIHSKVITLETKALFSQMKVLKVLQFFRKKLQIVRSCKIFHIEKYIYLQKFIADQVSAADRFVSLFKQTVIEPTAAILRQQLMSDSEGWFKVYTDRDFYLMSKLKRYFNMINLQLKDILKDVINDQFDRLIEILTKYVELKHNVQSINHIIPLNDNKLQPVIILELTLYKNNIKYNYSEDRFIKIMVNFMEDTLRRLSYIPSLESIVLKQIFGGYKNYAYIRFQINDQKDSSEPSKAEYSWIERKKQQVKTLIHKLSEQMTHYALTFLPTELNINLQFLTQNRFIIQTHQLINYIRQLTAVIQIISQQFPGIGVPMGFFYFQYVNVKQQIIEIAKTLLKKYKKEMLREMNVKGVQMRNNLEKLQTELSLTVKTLIDYQKRKNFMNNLEKVVKEMVSNSQFIKLYDKCTQFQCEMGDQHFLLKWNNMQLAKQLLDSLKLKQKQMLQIKVYLCKEIDLKKQDLFESIKMFQQSLLIIIKQNQYHKLSLLNSKLMEIKQNATLIISQQKVLELQMNNFDIINEIQKQFQKYVNR